MADLGAALVVERNKSTRSGGGGAAAAAAAAAKSRGYNEAGNEDSSSIGGGNNHRLLNLEQDMEGIVAQLEFEKQRNQTLQNELCEVSKERTDEATTNHSRKFKFDQQIAELSHTVARLESELLVAANNNNNSGGGVGAGGAFSSSSSFGDKEDIGSQVAIESGQ